VEDNPGDVLLIEETLGDRHGEFELESVDIEGLGRLAKIAAAAGAPFVSASGASFIGCESLAATPDPDDWSLPKYRIHVWLRLDRPCRSGLELGTLPSMKGISREPDHAASGLHQEQEDLEMGDALQRFGAKRQKGRKPTHLAVRPGRSEPILRWWEPAAAL